MKVLILKILIYSSGLVCLAGFLAIRIEPLFNLITVDNPRPGYWDDYKYGELYYFNNVWDFKEELPSALPKFQFSDKHADLGEADILTFGDSFLDFSRHVQLSERLKDSLGVEVFYDYSVYPGKLLATKNYHASERKLLVYERTERWIPYTFGIDEYGNVLDNTPLEPYDKSADNTIRDNFQKIVDYLFYDRSEELYRVLLQRSHLLSHLNAAISTLQFRWFGYVSSFTPEYALTEDRPWLFLNDQLDDSKSSFYYDFSDEEIEAIAGKIQKFSLGLSEDFNLELILVPVPSKATIYHQYFDDSSQYNNFLPRLYKVLDEKGIHYIDLYTPYSKAEEYVFYGTDEHWTEHGVSIATSELLKKIRQIDL